MPRRPRCAERRGWTGARCVGGSSRTGVAPRRKATTGERWRGLGHRHRDRRDGGPVPRRTRTSTTSGAGWRRPTTVWSISRGEDLEGGARAAREIDDPDYVRRARSARRRRGVRRRLLRHRQARRRDHGPAASSLHRVLLGSAGDGGSRARALRRSNRRVRRLRLQHLHAEQPAHEPGARRPSRHVPAPPHSERQGLPVDDGLVPARSARPVRERADRVLDVARRGAPRGAEPARVRVRHRARRWLDHPGSPPGWLRLPRGRDPLAGRLLPRLRRAVGGNGPHQRSRRRRASPPCRRPRRSRPDPRGRSRAPRSTTTVSARSATSLRASTATPTSSKRRSPSPGSPPATSSSSKHTAPARAWATRSRSRRSRRRSARRLPTSASAISCRRSRTSGISTPQPASPA